LRSKAEDEVAAEAAETLQLPAARRERAGAEEPTSRRLPALSWPRPSPLSSPSPPKRALSVVPPPSALRLAMKPSIVAPAGLPVDGFRARADDIRLAALTRMSFPVVPPTVAPGPPRNVE